MHHLGDDNLLWSLLARDAFVRTNRRAIAMMFVRLSVWHGRVIVIIRCTLAHLNVWLDNPMFWAP